MVSTETDKKDPYRQLFKLFGLFGFAFAGAYYFSERSMFGYLFSLSIGLSLILLSQSSLFTGRLRIKSGRYATREREPILFWLMYSIYLLGGVVLTVAGIHYIHNSF